MGETVHDETKRISPACLGILELIFAQKYLK